MSQGKSASLNRLGYRHSKHACSEAKQMIWNPAFSQRSEVVVTKAGFQIAHFAVLRFAFGMTNLIYVYS
jgi:hypothetical protein